MSSYEFMVSAKKAVSDWLMNRYAAEGKTISFMWTDVYIVWQAKVLKNHKAILAAPTPDQYMFEVTLNGEKNEMYLDAYDKVENRCISVKA